MCTMTSPFLLYNILAASRKKSAGNDSQRIADTDFTDIKAANANLKQDEKVSP